MGGTVCVCVFFCFVYVLLLCVCVGGGAVWILCGMFFCFFKVFFCGCAFMVVYLFIYFFGVFLLYGVFASLIRRQSRIDPFN